MRPRVFPAEDRGPRRPPWLSSGWPASMRPRVFPAEDSSRERIAGTLRSSLSFNEAAGIPRGRHGDQRMDHTWCDSGRSFNEAAGIPRGRHVRATSSHTPPIAMLQ